MVNSTGVEQNLNEQPEEYQRQSMDSQRYLRLEQNTAGGVKRQRQMIHSKDVLISMLTCSHYGKEGDSATMCK